MLCSLTLGMTQPVDLVEACQSSPHHQICWLAVLSIIACQKLFKSDGGSSGHHVRAGCQMAFTLSLEYSGLCFRHKPIRFSYITLPFAYQLSCMFWPDLQQREQQQWLYPCFFCHSWKTGAEHISPTDCHLVLDQTDPRFQHTELNEHYLEETSGWCTDTMGQ